MHVCCSFAQTLYDVLLCLLLHIQWIVKNTPFSFFLNSFLFTVCSMYKYCSTRRLALNQLSLQARQKWSLGRVKRQRCLCASASLHPGIITAANGLRVFRRQQSRMHSVFSLQGNFGLLDLGTVCYISRGTLKMIIFCDQLLFFNLYILLFSAFCSQIKVLTLEYEVSQILTCCFTGFSISNCHYGNQKSAHAFTVLSSKTKMSLGRMGAKRLLLDFQLLIYKLHKRY